YPVAGPEAGGSPLVGIAVLVGANAPTVVKARHGGVGCVGASTLKRRCTDDSLDLASHSRACHPGRRTRRGGTATDDDVSQRVRGARGRPPALHVGRPRRCVSG